MAQRVMVAAATTAIMLLATAVPASAYWATESSWTDARATFYGRDGWSIHTGSCQFGFICPNKWAGELAQGQDITAVSDRSDLYNHCGECLEVKCRSADIPDGGGKSLDRKGVCLNDKSVKVKITDTCPCNYPDNAESNKRWCCGDFPHLDLSQWAIEKITQETKRWGVFGISYRRISCTDPVSNEAPNIDVSPDADPYRNSKPSDLTCGAQPAAGLVTQSKTTTVNIRANSDGGGSSDGGSSPTRTPSPSPSTSTGYDPKKSYWQNWWHTTFDQFDIETKKRYYKKLWDNIRAGKLTRKGHKLPGRRLLTELA